MSELPAGTILGPFETEKEWLEVRRRGIGGSYIAAVMGNSPFASPLSVYYDLTEPREREINEAMNWGRVLEPVILEEWMFTQVTQHGWRDYLDRRLIIVQSNEFPWLLHSPDALIADGDGVYHSGVECKTTGTDRGWEDFEYGMPDTWYAQIQHGLFCTGLIEWHLVALVGGNKLIHRVIDRDVEFMGRMTLAADRFWHDHVIPRKPPAADGTKASRQALMHAWDSKDTAVEVSPLALDQYAEAQEKIAEWTAKAEEAKQAIMQEMAEAEVGTVGGEKAVTWRTQTRSSIDVSALKKEMPDLASKYTRTTTMRVFRVS